MNEAIEASYNEAKKLYARHGIQVDDILRKLSQIKISLHCWQGDDVQGFLFKDKQLSGGIAVTGSYPGRAGTPHELRQDLEKALSLIPGKHKVNLHAIYADTTEQVDLDQLEPRHFQNWVDQISNSKDLGLILIQPCSPILKRKTASH